MTFFSHMLLAFEYLFSRSYMQWFFTVPTAGAIIYCVGSLISMKRERGD